MGKGPSRTDVARANAVREKTLAPLDALSVTVVLTDVQAATNVPMTLDMLSKRIVEHVENCTLRNTIDSDGTFLTKYSLSVQAHNASPNAYEMAFLTMAVEALDRMGAAGRHRVIQYLESRYTEDT